MAVLVHLSNSAARSQQLVGARRRATKHPAPSPPPPAPPWLNSSCELFLLSGGGPPASCPLLQVFPVRPLFAGGVAEAGKESAWASR